MRVSKTEETRPNGPMSIRLAGPRAGMRQPDSMHLLSFEHGKYYNPVPITTDELRDLRRKIAEWLGDNS